MKADQCRILFSPKKERILADSRTGKAIFSGKRTTNCRDINTGQYLIFMTIAWKI